jgi:HSP20 family protein
MLPVIRKSANIPSLWDEFFGDNWMTNFWRNENGYSIPSANIAENDKEYRIEVAAPGMSKEDFKINLEEKVLAISSEKEEKHEEKEEKYMRQEFNYSSFRRTFILPETAEGEKISANYKDGVLHIQIPKKEEAKRLNKEIKVA